MTNDPPTFPPDLTPDSLADQLGGPFPGIPPGYVAIKGWLGRDRDGIHRIFTTDTFRTFFEIRKEDIAARVEIPRNERDWRSEFWIKRGATVMKGEVGYIYEMENGVWGTDPAGGGLGGHPPY
ncbi:MAG TPA: hypothetical protein VF526_05385 [Solirubrobacteraceae bacterium]|jgi:hypothetical protein